MWISLVTSYLTNIPLYIVSTEITCISGEIITNVKTNGIKTMKKTGS